MSQDETKRVVIGLALVLETACEDFELFQKFIAGDLIVCHKNPEYNTDDYTIFRPIYLMRAPGNIQMALAKSFLFNAVRAYRIVDGAKGILKIPRDKRKKFLDILKPAVNVRGVNEHGFDVSPASRRPNNRPAMHEHEGGLLDETSMYISGPEAVQMGPVNLYDLYIATAEMRAIAGFSSMPSEYMMG